jgi:hypothetical protein
VGVDASSALRSALAVCVPEAEPLVDGFRARFDTRSVALGIVPHVTVLFPFVDVPELPTVRAAVAAHFSAQPAFDAELVDVGRFDGHVWLAPAPRARWVELIEATCGRFPDTPPYAGAFDEPEPHLTVGEATSAHPLEAIAAAAGAELAPHLPVRFRVDAVAQLEEQPDGMWSVTGGYPLS